MAEKIIAEYDRPRYAVQALTPVHGAWEQVLTFDNEFNARTKAEEYAKKKDVKTRVIDREAEEE